MATTIRSNGLQHAMSLGNIEVAEKGKKYQPSNRCYDSDDENMGREKSWAYQAGFNSRASTYSKGDFREQYCLTPKQLSSIDKPKRFFGCWSDRGGRQSILGVCVGKRAPSDENINDYAPFYKYPRDPKNACWRNTSPANIPGIPDAKKYVWMPSDDETIKLEKPRPICPDFDDYNDGPYVVGSFPPKSYFSQSTEDLTDRSFGCPVHVGLRPPPPPLFVPIDVQSRAKHVSFARSHTLTSFEEASKGLRYSGRFAASQNKERLIGGKKPCIVENQLHHQPHPIIIPAATKMQKMTLQQFNALRHQENYLPSPAPLQQIIPNIGVMNIGFEQQPEQSKGMILKHGAMKTQATQTEVYVARKRVSPNLSLSPRTIFKVKMVSQGAQTNHVNGRKLTKSLSEVTGAESRDAQKENNAHFLNVKLPDHMLLHRTQSEEPSSCQTTLNVPTKYHYQ